MTTLKLKNISKTFGAGETAVRAVAGISLEVKKGEIVLIMGPSGSGKTTLLSIAGGILRPTSGSVTIRETVITDLDEKKMPQIRAKNIGFIFQSFNLLSALSARENVELAANLAGTTGKEAAERAEKLLKNLGLGHRLNAVPANLSGGEKQRVAIARALINDPKIILADEPTANLDSKIGHEVMTLLKEAAKKKDRSALIVSHDNRIRDVADRTLWLEDGQFKAIGKMTVDPVCEMAIEKGRHQAKYQDQQYYFCSQGCQDEFSQNPEKFLK